MAFVSVGNGSGVSPVSWQAVNEVIPKSIDILRNKRSNSHISYETLLKNPSLQKQVEVNKVNLALMEACDNLEVNIFS